MSCRRLLPDRRGSVVVEFDLDGQHYRATGSYFGSGTLAEVFLDVGKAGSAVQTHADDAAVLASLALQYGVPAEVIRHSITGPIARALDLLAEDRQ